MGPCSPNWSMLQNKKSLLELPKGSFRTNKKQITQQVRSKRDVSATRKLDGTTLSTNHASPKVKDSKP